MSISWNWSDSKLHEQASSTQQGMWLQQFDRRRASATEVSLLEAASILLGIPRIAGENNQQKVDYAATVRALQQDFYGSLAAIVAHADALPDAEALRLGHVLQRGGFSFEATFAHGGHARELHDAVMLAVQRMAQQQHRIPVTVDHVAVAVDGSMLSYAALDAAAHVLKHGKLLVVNIVDEVELPALAREHLLADVRRRCKHQYKIPDDRVEVISVPADSEEGLQQLLLEHHVRVIVLGMQGHRRSEGMGHLASWAARSENPFSCVLTNAHSRKCALHQRQIAYKFLMPLPTLLQSREGFQDFWTSSLQMMQPGDSLSLLCFAERCADDSDATDSCAQEFFEMLDALATNATIEATVRRQTLEKQCTAAQEALRVVEEEQMDVILLPKQPGKPRAYVEECCRAARCTVALV